MNEICDERRFTKVVGGGIKALRYAVNDGLFTGYVEEHNWQVAHRTLMPAFGPISISGMFDEMHDIASQLVAKWARFGPNEKFNVNADFTRLTLDTITL
jgi:cytochrome P450/NADPH-cytochrome P450 reductase